jgi:RNA polymerase sigma-70 factor (ECF subfamily)
MGKVALSEAAPIANRSAVVRHNSGVSTKTATDQVNSTVLTRDRVGQEADLPSFEQLFHRYAPYVLHALPYLGVAQADIEDVCQDVFATVYQNLGKFERRSSVRTWIYGICLNKVLNYRRLAHRRRERLEPSSEQSVECRQNGLFEQKQAYLLLSRALAELDKHKREVFVLYEIEELSMVEVAQALGCPLFTAYSRLYAARREVKKTVARLISDRNLVRSVSP